MISFQNSNYHKRFSAPKKKNCCNKNCSVIKLIIKSVMSSALFDLVSCSLALINVVAINLLQDSYLDSFYQFNEQIIIQFTVNFMFGFTVIFDVISFGKLVLKRSWRFYPELLCQFINLAVFI